MKFFHTADIHLGAAPDVGCSWNKERKSDQWETFRRFLALAKKQKIDLLLLAGDIFHGQPTLGEVKELNALLAKLEDTQVVMIAGNHDYIGQNSPYLKIKWADNVYGLWQSQLSHVYLPKLNTYVYGASYHKREIKEGLYQGIFPMNREGIHILLGHGGDACHSPIDFKRLEEAGFDYVALGHIHKPQILYPHKMAYAGALEPIDKNDEGSHGFIAGKIEKGQTQIRQIPFARWEYKRHEIKISPDMTQTDVEAYLQKLSRESSPTTLWKIELKGKRDMDLVFDRSRLFAYGKIIEVKDESRIEFSAEDLKKIYQGTFIDLYIRQFENMPSGRERQKALEYGLWALLEAKE